MRRSEHDDYARCHYNNRPLSNKPLGHPEELGRALKEVVSSYIGTAEAFIDTTLFMILGEAALNSVYEDPHSS